MLSWRHTCVLGGVVCRSAKSRLCVVGEQKAVFVALVGAVPLATEGSVCAFGSDEARRRQTNNEHQTVFVAVN